MNYCEFSNAQRYLGNFTYNNKNLHSSMRENSQASADILSSPPLLTAVGETISWFSSIENNAHNFCKGLNDASALGKLGELRCYYSSNNPEKGLIAITGLVAIHLLSPMLAGMEKLSYVAVYQDKEHIVILPQNSEVRIIIHIQDYGYDVRPSNNTNEGFIDIYSQTRFFVYNGNPQQGYERSYEQSCEQQGRIIIPQQRLIYRHDNANNQEVILIPSTSQTIVDYNKESLDFPSQYNDYFAYNVDNPHQGSTESSSEGVTQQTSWSESVTTICESMSFSSESMHDESKQMLFLEGPMCDSPKQMSLSIKGQMCESPNQVSFFGEGPICESPKQMSLSIKGQMCEGPNQMPLSSKSTLVFEGSPSSESTLVFEGSPSSESTLVFEGSPSSESTLVFESSPSSESTTTSYKKPKQMSWSESIVSRKSSSKGSTRCSWDDKTDWCLLSYLEKNKDKVRKLKDNRSGVKVGLWHGASEWMSIYGHNYSQEQCFNRWKNSIQDYKRGSLSVKRNPVRYNPIGRILGHSKSLDDHNKRKISNEEKELKIIREIPGQESREGKRRK